MNILGIVGSPRGEAGRSHQVVTQVLAGAQGVGSDTEVLYLVDEEPGYCIDCGHACFAEDDCTQEEGATARSRQVDEADALVICAPVYCWQPNGLTAALFDKVRLSTGSWNRGRQHGRAALGIAVAGGTGTGVFTALQSIYAWLCLWKYRPLDPLPVIRFNMDQVLDRAPALGRALAVSTPQPYDDAWEVMLTYDRLPYMDYGRIDEFRWLAERTADGLECRGEQADGVGEVRRLLQEGHACAGRGDSEGQAKCYVKAYRLGAKLW